MRNLASIVANYDSASTGFSDGKLRDNPGSGVLCSGMNKEKIYENNYVSNR